MKGFLSFSLSGLASITILKIEMSKRQIEGLLFKERLNSIRNFDINSKNLVVVLFNSKLNHHCLQFAGGPWTRVISLLCPLSLGALSHD